MKGFLITAGILITLVLLLLITNTSLKSIFNPVTRPISFETGPWGTFVKLTPKTIKVDKSKNDVHRRLNRLGFKPTQSPYHQSLMCRALADNKIDSFIGSHKYLEKCRAFKMDIVRRYENRSEYSDKNGKPIYAVIFPEVFIKKSSEFPCNVKYAIYPFYNNEMKLIDAFGVKNEAGCL